VNIHTKTKIFIGLLSIWGVFLFWSCNSQEAQTWLYIEPTQCLSNTWDQEWLQTHDYNEYPQNEAAQLKIVTDYYRDHGVVIHDIYTRKVYEAVCAACSCPTGDRIYSLVQEQDVDFMLAEGWLRPS